jgi:hypothetical protein
MIYSFSVLCCTVLIKATISFYVNSCMYFCCNVDRNLEKKYFEQKLKITQINPFLILFFRKT